MAPKCLGLSGEGCHRPIIYKSDGTEVGALKPSKYCDKHTCIGFAGEDPCFKKVVRNGETRCITHVQCTALFCEEPRMAAANGGWWDCCSNHKCGEDGCMDIRQYQNAKERYFKYCSKHKCIKSECENGIAGQRKYCGKHTCTRGTCNNMVEEEEKLCSAHLQCDHDNCTKKRVFRGGHYQQFCTQHLICEVVNCTREKRDNSRYCINHTCFKRECTKPGGSNFYCTDHTCEVADCQNARAYFLDNMNTPAKSRYCPIHECRKEGCHRSSKNGMFGYCADHNCDRADCNNLKLIDPGSITPLLLCRKHYDESRDRPTPEAQTPTTPTPAPAPAPTPQRLDPIIEVKLDALKREQREQRDRLDDIMSFLQRRL